jgi:hypothetical protein
LAEEPQSGTESCHSDNPLPQVQPPHALKSARECPQNDRSGCDCSAAGRHNLPDDSRSVCLRVVAGAGWSVGGPPGRQSCGCR